ncbi:MAG: 4'-phosphopantetheinyl transferase family protein [Micromonosporaceae bacterium]
MAGEVHTSRRLGTFGVRRAMEAADRDERMTPTGSGDAPASAGDLAILPIGDEVHVWHRHQTGQPHDAAQPHDVAQPHDAAQPHDVAPQEADLAILSEPERARAARFVRPADRSRYVAMHAGARRLLARYLGTDAAAIRFARTPCCKCGSLEHGRPRIEWPATTLTHNLSGSGEHWLLAVADGRPVGVDLEILRDIDIERMAEACLTDAERAYLSEQPQARRLKEFFRCWTRKEAVVKACGVGLAAKLTGLEVHPGRRERAEVRHSSGSCPDTWLVEDLPGGPDWAGAVAQPAEQAGPVVFRALP